MYKIEKVETSYSQTYYNIFDNNGGHLLSLYIFQNELWAIQIHSTKYHTKNKISVGDLAIDVKSKGYANMVLQNKNSLYSQKGNIYLYFEKKITKSGEIDEEAKLTSIAVGHHFQINNI